MQMDEKDGGTDYERNGLCRSDRGKERYTKYGVHKGMQGWICHDAFVNGTWLVNFPQWGAKADIATISVKETDLKLIPRMDARINEQIRAQYEGK